MRTGYLLAGLFLALTALGAAPKPLLYNRIQHATGKFPGNVFIYAKHLDSGRSFSLRGDERVRTASTIKLPVMAAVFAAVEAGTLRWDETVELTESAKVSGSGVVRELSAGLRLPVRDLVRLMIVVSDNTATNLLLDRIGADAVNALLDHLGLTATRSLRKIRGDGTQLAQPSGWSAAGLIEENKQYGIGVSTPREMVALLEMLENGKVVSAAASKEMLAILERQQYKDGIGRRWRLKTATKSGALDALRSDVGIVYTKSGRLAVAITVDGMKEPDWSPDNAANKLISEITGYLIDGLAEAGK